MNAKRFADTNILIYAIETGGRDSWKGDVARSLLRVEECRISTQVLGEFYRAVTSRRRAVPLSHNEAVSWVQFWKRFPVIAMTVVHVDLALEVCERFGLSYHDAQIVAAARLANCEIVYSEDLNAGQDYGGVVVVNPFRE